MFPLSPSISRDPHRAETVHRDDGRIGLNKNGLMGQLSEASASAIYRDGEFVADRGRLSTMGRQIVGSSRWAGRIHFNLGCGHTVLSATIKQFPESVRNAKSFLLRSNRTIRELGKRMGIFRYVDSPNDITRPSISSQGNMTLFLLTDDGCASSGYRNLPPHS